MRARVNISTPFPSVRVTAAELKVPPHRVRALTKLMRAIQAGHNVSFVDSLEALSQSRPFRKMAMKRKLKRKPKPRPQMRAR